MPEAAFAGWRARIDAALDRVLPAPDAAPAPEAPASPQLELGIEPPAAAPAPSTRPAAP